MIFAQCVYTGHLSWSLKWSLLNVFAKSTKEMYTYPLKLLFMGKLPFMTLFKALTDWRDLWLAKWWLPRNVHILILEPVKTAHPMAKGTLQIWLNSGSWDGEMILDNLSSPDVITASLGVRKVLVDHCHNSGPRRRFSLPEKLQVNPLERSW